MFEKHEGYKSSDFREHSSIENCKELMRGLLNISDAHGCSLLRDNSFFHRHSQAPRRSSSDTGLGPLIAYVRLKHTDDNKQQVRDKYNTLNTGQKKFVDEVVVKLDQKFEETQAGSSGLASILQRYGKTSSLKVLRERAECKGHITLVCATTGKAASLYEQGHTLHNLLGLGIDDRVEDEVEASRSSSFKPRSKRAYFEIPCWLLISKHPW